MALGAAFLALSFGAAVAGSRDEKLLKQAEIKEILGKIRIGEMLENTANAMAPRMLDMVRKKHPELSPEQGQALTDLLRAIVAEQMPILEKNAVDAYDETFSAEEIHTLFQFYATPAGAAIASKTADAQLKLNERGKLWAKSILGPEFLKRLRAAESLKSLAP